jgi:hypothetical protein
MKCGWRKIIEEQIRIGVEDELYLHWGGGKALKKFASSRFSWVYTQKKNPNK